MGSILEQSLASAVRYVQEHIQKGTKMYFDEIPEDFYVPSVYFPVPRSSGRKVSLDSYLITIYFEARFMASENWLAEAAAEQVRDSLLLDNCRIDSMNEDGTSTGMIFHVTNVETILIENGIARLSFGIFHYISKDQQNETKINTVDMVIGNKSAPLYSAWVRATKGVRKNL